MSVALYMDVHVRRAITEALRLRGVDVLTAQEDMATRLLDPALLDRASQRQRVLFSQDEDLLAEATRRQRSGVPFDGVIYAHQLRVNIGRCIQPDLRSPTLKLTLLIHYKLLKPLKPNFAEVGFRLAFHCV